MEVFFKAPILDFFFKNPSVFRYDFSIMVSFFLREVWIKATTTRRRRRRRARRERERDDGDDDERGDVADVSHGQCWTKDEFEADDGVVLTINIDINIGSGIHACCYCCFFLLETWRRRFEWVTGRKTVDNDEDER